MTFQGKHFPGDYKDDLYVFGISGTRRMGSDKELIQILKKMTISGAQNAKNVCFLTRKRVKKSVIAT